MDEENSKNMSRYLNFIAEKNQVKYLIITNSAGSLKIENPPGNFMIADSHMDFTFRENAKLGFSNITA